MNSNQNLFIKLTEEFNDEIYKLSDTQLAEIFKMQKQNRDKILSEIANIVLEYHVAEENMVLNEGQKASLTKKLNEAIEGYSVKGEINNVEDILKTVGVDKYYSNSFITSLGLDFTIKKITDKQLINIVNTALKGEMWSNRIWDNKSQLEKVLKKEINDFLSGKVSINMISKNIKDIYNVQASESKRLVRTETARVLEQANEQWCDDNNIEYQLFSATLDNKTSEKCAELDGKVFKYDDTNKPICPLHPYCRSTLIAIPNKEWRPNKRFDNESRVTIDYKKYKEWKENNI